MLEYYNNNILYNIILIFNIFIQYFFNLFIQEHKKKHFFLQVAFSEEI